MANKRYVGWTDRDTTKKGYADLDTRFSSYNTKAEGLIVDSVADDFAALNLLANTTMQPAGGILDIVGVPRIASDLTIPANVRLNFVGGAYLAPDAGKTVTINGPFNRHLDKKFGGGGAIVFGKGSMPYLSPHWWGAKGDGSDDTLPFQATGVSACATALATGFGVKVRMASQSGYVVTGTVLTNQYRVNWAGAGKFASHITFAPTVDGTPLFKNQFANPALEIAQCAFQDFSVSGSGVKQKIIFDLYDTSDQTIQNVVITSSVTSSERRGTGSITTGTAILTSPALAFTAGDVGKTVMIGRVGVLGAALTTTIIGFTNATTVTIGVNASLTGTAVTVVIAPNTAAPSIGVRTFGRELTRLRNMTIFADRPIHIVRNPNAPSLSCDHFHGTDLYLAPQLPTESSLVIDGDAGIGNVTLDGQQAHVGGKSGVFAKPGAPPTTAFSVNIANGRFEQQDDLTGFAFDWEMPVSNLTLTNMGLSNGNGIKLRNAGAVTIIAPIHSGVAGTVALDMDNTCDGVEWKNATWGTGATASLGTMVEVWSSPKRITAIPLPPSALYINPATTLQAQKVNGAFEIPYIATVVSGGTMPLPMLAIGNGLKTAIVSVYGRSATGPIDEYGDAVISTTQVIIKAGSSANFVNTNTAGKLCLFFNGGNPITIINNTAQTLSIVVKTTSSYT